MKTKLLALLTLGLAGVAQAETYMATVAGTTFTHEWTLPLELSSNDTLVVTVNGNSDQSAVDWTGITGTGTIRLGGTGVLTLPNADYRFAETLAVASDVSLKLAESWRTTNGGYTVTQFKTRDFNGCAALSRYTERSRCHLWTTQSTVTEWSGELEKSYEYGGTQYGVYLWVASDGAKATREKALIVSGDQKSNQTLNIEPTGCVILRGQWKGTINNNGLLVIAPGVDRSQFTVNGSGKTEIQQANEVIVIAPPALKTMWEEEFAPAYAEIHPGYTCSVVSTADIYNQYPYDAANADGNPRNPAESIHAFIKDTHNKDGNEYFILGGPWVNIDDLATNKVMKLATGETLTLTNTVPGVKVSPDARYSSPTDMYYACFDSANAYAWDPDGDGRYLNTNEFERCDMTASVVVARLPLVTWSEWKHADDTLYTPRELLVAYVEKMRKGLSQNFEGASRYGIYGYLINESGVQKLGGSNESWVERKETAFYDNGYNMFDPARGSDDFWLVEGVSRRRVRDQIAAKRPVDDVNGFLEATFNRNHADWNVARSAWKTENYALRFYYAHGTRGGGHGFSMDDYKLPGCGLTLFDDCAGPCSTGKIEFDANGVYQMNYAIACVTSPYGGSLATVNNSDFGIADLNNYWKGFAPNDSWRYANNYLVGFVQENRTVGDAWRANVMDFITNYKFNKSAIDTWMLAEEMMLGDPLVQLPAVEDGLAYADGVTYKGLVDKKDVVVSMNVDTATAIETSNPLKVMNGLAVSGSALTLDTGAGGIGGEGVTFSGEKGTLTLSGNEPFYVAGVKNGQKVVVTGKGATLDFDSFEISEIEIGAGADVTIRSNTRGALEKIGNALTIPANATVRLATWDAFGDTRGTITVGADAKLIIEPNPSYHDGNNRGESLNADIVFEDGVTGFNVETSSEATFTGDQDPRVTYTEVSAYPDELYYPNSATDWTGSVRGRMTGGSAGSGPIGSNTLVRFTSSYGIVYIHDDVRCSQIAIENGANVQIGYWDNTWTVPSNWTVDIGAGSALTIVRWDNDTAGVVKIGDNVTLNGEGVVNFANTVTSVNCGNISGTATITLAVGVTLSTTGTIENPIVVPVGYRLKTTTAGGVTTYAAEDQRGIAFEKEWTYFYTGAGDDLAEKGNWSTLSGGKFVAAAKAPLVTGSEAWDPALFDGTRMELAASADGYKHVTSSAKVEGWALKVGLTNGVCLTINELEKLQNNDSAEQYAYVDATSKLIVEKFNKGKGCVMPFAIAAEEGLVWEADSSASGNTFVYSFSGNGSVTFVGTSNVATHQIASAEIELGEGDGKTILSKKLIAFNSKKSNTSTCGFASEVRIVTDDPEVLGVTKSEPVTTDDAVGTCSLRKEADGLYLDYVGRAKIIHTFKVGLEGDEAGKFWLDGKEFLIRCGEMHYGRIPRAYWRDRIRKTKAMGFNAVCAYMFWNNHEPVPGHFRFDGEQDVREFCKIAQEEGLWVVLRPGPYTCAEWEFGGYPWWLLSSKMSEDGQINIRTKDADYRYYTDRYMQKVGEQLADMQITRGGNIIMIQVENEYGTYGNDTEYMKMEYDAIVKAGFEIQKFTCNPTFNNGVTNARIPELFYVVNGSGGFFEGENRMQKLIDARLPGWENAPLMIGEYYTAWYDSWGGTHQTKAASTIVNDFRTFIERGVSFSVYMVYGGTSFGYWGGFNTPFVPMTTSYDYDSPINETGKLTDKFYAIKELFDQHLNEGETAVADEDVPSWVGVQSGTIPATPTVASLWDAPSYTKVIEEPTDAPLTFENADLGYGYAIYETTLAAGQGGKLMADCRDLGVVRVDGEFVGYLDRRTTWGWVEIEPADHPRKLEILVEALGRNHYAAFNDASKGLRGKPTLDKIPLSGWTMKTFDFLKWDEEQGAYASEMDNLQFSIDENPSARSGTFYKYNVTLDPSKDALLDMRAWRRGMVCVNGTWVGRYWTIGPQQTLYIPGCWLKEGENANEIIILDTVGVEPQNELTFAETHIISENRSDLDYYTPPELPELPKSLEALWGDAVKEGELSEVRGLQSATFDHPLTGRYVAFKATSAHSGQYAACAEFNLLDASGNTLDRTNWKIVSCSSQEQRGEDAQIEKILDGDNSTIWHSEWKVVQSTLPQYFVIDLGEEQEIGGFTWLGRQSGDAGFVKGYSVYVMNENPAIDPETGVTISSGTLEEPFVVPASDLNNVKVTIKSGAVLKVNATANCRLTISGEGKDSVLIVGGSDYGFAEGSVFRDLTIQVDAGCNIWFETRNSNPYDGSVDIVVPTGATATVNNDGNYGNVITVGSLTIDGGTIGVRNNTTFSVTDTLYLREGATQPAGVTLAPGATIEYLKLALVLDSSCFKNDGSEKALDWETLASAKFVGVADSSTLDLAKIASVTIRDSVNLGIRPALKGLKLIVDNNATVRFPMSGNGMTYCLEGVDVDVKAGSSVKITRAWGTGWTKGNDNTFNLKDSRIHGEGAAVVPSAVTIALDNSSIELPFAAADQAKVTLPESLTFDAQGYIVPKKPAVDFADPETITETTTAEDLGLTNAAFASDDGATLKKVAAWAQATGTSLATLNGVETALADAAYLLAVAPTPDAVAAAKAAFRFNVIEPGKAPTIDSTGYNGTVTIWGATTLKDGGNWRTDHESPLFFKARLTR